MSKKENDNDHDTGMLEIKVLKRPAKIVLLKIIKHDSGKQNFNLRGSKVL